MWKQLKNSVGCLHARLVMTYRSSSLGQEETPRASAWDVLLQSGEVSHNTTVLTGTLRRQFTEWCLQFFSPLFLRLLLEPDFIFWSGLSKHHCTFGIQKEGWTRTKMFCFFVGFLNRCKSIIGTSDNVRDAWSLRLDTRCVNITRRSVWNPSIAIKHFHWM